MVALRHAREVVRLLFGPPHERSFAVRYWDDSVEACRDATPRFTLVVARQGSLRRMLLPPNELTIVEAYLSGDMDLEGEIEAAMTLGDDINQSLRSPATIASLVRHLIALPKDDGSEDVRAHRAEYTVGKAGEKHERERDKAAIQYHYDVGNDFYALWLDERMVYTCAYFERGVDPVAELGDAQRDKLDLVCRKLRLQPGEQFLDVGCGWGALIMHAAQNYGVNAVGITISEEQAALARRRIEEAGLSDRCRVEIRDYRDLGTSEFDKASSVGMIEAVGEEKLPVYFESVHRALRPGGLFLNHGIVNITDSRPPSRWDWLEKRLWKRDAFIEQYVFPDGRLTALTPVIAAAEGVGFETRDMQSLREHYPLTLRAWVTRLRARKAEAIALTNERMFRTWLLYMTASAYGFASGRLNLVQILLVKPDAQGRSHLPLRRSV